MSSTIAPFPDELWHQVLAQTPLSTILAFRSTCHDGKRVVDDLFKTFLGQRDSTESIQALYQGVVKKCRKYEIVLPSTPWNQLDAVLHATLQEKKDWNLVQFAKNTVMIIRKHHIPFKNLPILLQSTGSFDIESAESIREWLKENRKWLSSLTYLYQKAEKETKLVAIPRELTFFSGLIYLHLGSNSIKTIPRFLSELQALKTLVLVNNEISEVRSDLSETNPTLELLDLRSDPET